MNIKIEITGEGKNEWVIDRLIEVAVKMSLGTHIEAIEATKKSDKYPEEYLWEDDILQVRITETYILNKNYLA